MWYITLEIGKIRQRQAVQIMQSDLGDSAQFPTRLLANIGKLFVVIGYRLQSKHQYGTVLHAG